MFDRKQAKKKAKRNLKQHYVIFVIAILVASFIGSEYQHSFKSTKSGENSVTLKSYSDSYESTFVDLLLEDMNAASENSKAIILQKQSEDVHIGPIELGHTQGVFANSINTFASGSVFVIIYNAIRHITHSTDILAIIGVVLAAIVMSIFSIFVKSVYRIVYKRIFLEGYNYKEVKAHRFLYLVKVKKYFNAAIATFIKEVYLTLWFFTIIGIFIKTYSYALVDYIIAENPSIKANQAISLSRKMMNGHKWELFTYDLSFILWNLLDTLTLGISGLLYSNAYREAFKVQYYVYLRQLAIDNKIEGYELLNDKYLYEYAADDLLIQTYADIYDKKDINVDLKQFKGLKGFLMKNFGLCLRYDNQVNQYEQYVYEKSAHEYYKDIFAKEDFPSRLGGNSENERNSDTVVNAQRAYSLTSIIIIFFAFSIVGWIWEVSLHLLSDGTFVNRGVLHGPWLPVYGSGVVLIMIILYRFRKSIPEHFLSAVILCGFVEYYTSVYLEMTHNGMRWWDYTGYFLNVNGRICAEGLLVFGLGGCAAVYILAPIIDNKLKKVKPVVLSAIAALLVICFVADSIYSKSQPNMGEGITNQTSYVTREDSSC